MQSVCRQNGATQLHRHAVAFSPPSRSLPLNSRYPQLLAQPAPRAAQRAYPPILLLIRYEGEGAIWQQEFPFRSRPPREPQPLISASHLALPDRLFQLLPL